MSVGIWIVRSEARKLGEFLASNMNGRLYEPGSDKERTNRESFAAEWLNHREWIFIASCGIVVRYLQGLAIDKMTDPAVVVVDEAARFAISLLSGHEGGANNLAYRVARSTGAVPVITTATEALKPLVLGIGCRKDIAMESVEAAVKEAMRTIGRRIDEVREVVTVDLKANEPALVKWCDENGVPLRIIPLELLKLRPWVTKPSSWVMESIGVEGVCEPCALLATLRGKLILPKFAHQGVTVAVVEEGAFL